MAKVEQKLTKALKISYALMDCHLVDVHWLSKAFGGARIWNFEIKATDSATIFAYLGKSGRFQIDYWGKLRQKDEKWIGWCRNWTPVTEEKFRVLTTRPQVLIRRNLNFDDKTK